MVSVVKMCPTSPFLPLKYAIDALESCKNCAFLLESIVILVSAYQKRILDYSDHPSFVHIISQYALSKDFSVSKPAQAILLALYSVMNEQLFAYIPGDKAPAIRELVSPQITIAALSANVCVGSGLVASSPEPISKFTEEELENLGKAIEQALKERDFDGLVRRVTALHQVLAGAIADGTPPPPHVYEAETLLTAMARVVPIMLRDKKIEVPVVGAIRTLNECLKRGYLDLQGLSQEGVGVLLRALLLRKNEELHRSLVILFKLGNPFRITVALVQLARSTISADEATITGTQKQCAQVALCLLDEAALLCARAADPERGGLLGLLNELRNALTESMMNEKPPYEVAKACVRTLRTIHSGNRPLTEKLCKNVQMLTTFLEDSKETGTFTATSNEAEVDENKGSTEVERSHTPLGQMQK